MFHDDGIPDSLSDNEKEYVLSVWEQADQHFDEVIEKINLFVEHPERETEICKDLAEAYDQLFVTSISMNEAPFYVQFAEVNEVSLKMKAKAENEFLTAIDELVEEILRRREQGDVDQAAYDLLASSINRELNAGPTVHCNPNQCRWCQARNALINYCRKKMGIRQTSCDSSTLEQQSVQTTVSQHSN